MVSVIKKNDKALGHQRPYHVHQSADTRNKQIVGNMEGSHVTHIPWIGVTGRLGGAVAGRESERFGATKTSGMSMETIPGSAEGSNEGRRLNSAAM